MAARLDDSALPADPPAAAPSVITPPRTLRTTPPPSGERGQVKSLTFAQRRYLGDPNPEKLTSAIVTQMEKDPQVRAGIIIRELAILGKPGKFNYTPKDPQDAEETARGERMVAFLTHVWNNLKPDPNRILRNILSARRYGFSVGELVWASTRSPTGEPELKRMETPEFYGFVYPERIKHLPSSSMESGGFATDEFGRLRAVHQSLTKIQRPTEIAQDIVLAQSGDDAMRLNRITFEGPDLQRLIVYTANPKDDGDYYGTSDHKAAYERWYSKQAALSGRDILLERLAGVVLGEYANPTEQDGLSTALDNTAAGAVLTVPKESNVRILEGAEGQITAFHESVRYDDVQILRAYLVPNETVGGSDDASGSFARANSHFNSFLLTLGQIQTELEEVVEEQFVKRVIDANYGEQETYPSFDFPDPADKDLEILSRIYQTAINDGYLDPSIDAAYMRGELGLPPAPEGHVFTKPQPVQADPFGGIFGPPKAPAGMAARLAAAASDPTAPSLFESVDHPAANAQSVDAHELDALSQLTRLVTTLRDDILTTIPQSAADVDQLRVDPARMKSVLDDLARSVYESVRADMARKFDALNMPRASERVLSASAPKRRLFGLLAAAEGDSPAFDALRSYLAWSAALNDELATREAATLQSRLRMRVIQAYASGMTPREVAASLADEFASYTGSQLQTVTKTTVMDYYNSARRSNMDAAGDYVRGAKLVPLLDKATTPFCRDLAGRSIAKTDPDYNRMTSMPFWYACRTTLIPILSDERDHVFDTDWPQWIAAHANTEGGGFLYGKS